MTPHAITVGAFESECYLWTVPEIVVIDPGADADAIKRDINDLKIPVAAYLLTHGHFDHVSALTDLLAAHPAPVYIHEADAAWAFSEVNKMPPFYDSAETSPADLRFIVDGRRLTFGDQSIEVIGSPGHTPGSVCYYVQDAQTLFSGDTLFRGSVGRTDLPGGDGRKLQASLKRLAALPPDTLVYPGHGPATRINEERRINPFLRFP